MMHIAFLTPEYPTTSAGRCGGLGTSLGTLARGLVRAGVKVSVILYGQERDERREEEGVILHFLRQRHYLAGGWFLYRKYIQARIKTFIEEEQIDLIEVPDWTGISAFMSFRVPVVMRFHGSDTYFCQLENRRQKVKNRWLEWYAVRGADAFIAPSTFAGERSARLFGLRQKVTRIPYGIDVSYFSNPKPDAFERGTLLYLGTLIRKKGVLELPFILRCVRRQYPNVKLILIGNDSADSVSGRTSTYALFQEALHPDDQDAVTYLGSKPYHEVQDFIRNAHICLFPTFAETFGMVTVESMAMRKAVVNSDGGWAHELMANGESGFLVDPHDHEAFANTIVRLLTDDALTSAVGAAARNFVEKHFAIATIVTQNQAFYHNCIVNGTRRT